MRALSLAELKAPLGAGMRGGDATFGRVSTDSRSVVAGDLFVALQGDKYDGHKFIGEVQRAGAVAALVGRAIDSALPHLVVKNTQRALGLLGSYNRQLFQGVLIAITGSVGKTTVKNMLYAVLSQRGATLATEANFNNEIGVPLTLLRLSPEHRYGVVEMGAARSGDIAWLCELGRPSVALLLNAMPAHLEGFGSIDDVANAKGEIFDGLNAGDVAVINADQVWAPRWRERAGAATILDFGLKQPAAITATGVRSQALDGISFTAHTPAGDLPLDLALPGRHNVANALAAVAVGLACDLSLAQIRLGLESVRPVAGRLLAQRAAGGATVIDDSYNANPASVKAAIDMLASCGGERYLVLGAMRELGAESAALHRDVVAYAREAGIEGLWGVGPELEDAVARFGDGGQWFEDCDALLRALPGEFGSEQTLLVKGSHSVGMERVVEALLQAPTGSESSPC